VAPLPEHPPAALGPSFQPPVQLHTEALRNHFAAQACERTEPERLAAHDAESRGAEHAVEHLRRDHVDHGTARAASLSIALAPTAQPYTTEQPFHSFPDWA
jgi:hypothetical protein